MAATTAAVIGGAAAIKGTIDAKKAAGRAADVQVAGQEAAIGEQRRQFDITQEQAEPFRQAGLGALEQQQALLGLSGQEAQQQAFQAFEESPGQQFLRERGERALLRNASAIGGLGGGNVRSALQQQGIGFAQQNLQNQLAQLGGIAGQGQAATTNVAALGAQTAGNIGAGLTGAAQARASGILGQQQAQTQGINQLLQTGGQFFGAGGAGGFGGGGVGVDNFSGGQNLGGVQPGVVGGGFQFAPKF